MHNMESLYKCGKLLYVCRKNGYLDNWENGLFVLYKDCYKGNEDLSYHGSPSYETFIKCEYLNSRDEVVFGSEDYCWRPVNEYIKVLQRRIKEINKFSYI